MSTWKNKTKTYEKYINETISYLTIKKLNGRYYECVCKCGKNYTNRACNIIAKRVESCGCLKKEKARTTIKKLGLAGHGRLKYGESAFNRLFRNYSREAKKKKVSFLLEKEEFANIIKKNCTYCGIEPTQKMHVGLAYGTIKYNGIDRVKPELGYIKNNVVSCCGECNRTKYTKTIPEFMEYIKRVYTFNNL